MRTRTIIALGAISASTLCAQAGGVTSWLNPVDGNWNVDANWNTGVIPGLSDSALLGLGSAYTVTMPASQSMASLMITNPSVLLNIANGTTQAIAGDFLNDGMVSVNFTGSISATTVRFDADSMLSGSGSILLNSSATRARIQTGVGFTFTQGSGHMIHGQGQIEGAMINNGTVSSDSGTSMSLLTNNKTNNSIMQAVNASEMIISGIAISQGIMGVIRSDGAGSRVTLTGATINGGLLESINAGDISIAGSVTLNSVDVTGLLDVENSRTLTVGTVLTNDGTIVINPDGSISATQILFNDSMTVGGSGEFVLASADSRARIQTSPATTVTMNPMLTISGRGRIEASMINDGLIHSDVAEIRMTTNNKINNGTMKATGGAILEFTGITTTQGVAGRIEADGPGSQIEFLAATVVGGELASLNGADVSVDSSSTFDSVDFSGELNVQNSVTLSIDNGLTNNGTITVNPAGNISATQILFNHSMTLGGKGEIVLASSDSRARIQTAGGAVLTMPATQTIRGFGRVEADMVNNGTISSDVGNEIRLTTNPKANNSTIEAVNSSIIEVNSITIDQSGGGELTAAGGGAQIELLSATIEGGTLSASGGADVSVDSSSTMNGVIISGPMNVQNSVTLSVGNSLTNNGVIDINPAGNISATQILFTDSLTVSGAGTIKLSSSDARARVLTSAEKTVTMSAGQTIHGRGRIEASMINNGTITSDVLGGEIRMTTNSKTNNAIMRAINDSTMEFDGITLTQGGGGEVSADGADSEIELRGTTISGGSLTTTGGADVSVDTFSILDGVDFSGLLNIPNNSKLGITFATLNNGMIVVNETGNISTTSLQWNEEMILGGSGTIRLNSSGARARLIGLDGLRGGIGSEQRLEGIGQIAIDLINDGVIAPGLSIGTMTAIEPIFFAGIAGFEAEVNDATADLLDSTSTIELHGTLDVLYVDGFSPVGFWARTIIEGSDITGKFDVVNIPPAPVGLVNRVINTGTEVIIGATCLSDQNLDGMLNFFDVSVFLAAFAVMDPSADITGDGQFNFFDVSAFLMDFGADCPL